MITGEADPQAAGWHIISRPGAATQWCLVKLGPSGAILTSRGLASNHWQPALQVLKTLHHPLYTCHKPSDTLACDELEVLPEGLSSASR